MCRIVLSSYVCLFLSFLCRSYVQLDQYWNVITVISQIRKL